MTQDRSNGQVFRDHEELTATDQVTRCPPKDNAPGASRWSVKSCDTGYTACSPFITISSPLGEIYST